MTSSIEPAMTFPYTLDPFQQESVNAIEKQENVLVTAHTSAGKSTVAEYAIAKCAKLGKKSIYTSPIKTLSNQKYADFIKHAENIGITPDDIGIMTGDIKLKPDASCLVMTTEILRNKLFQLDNRDDFFSQIQMVIFDEVHYINDPDRGHVWEETILMLPSHIQRIMLSASISGAEVLSNWVTNISQRETQLISTSYRPVPLVHQLYYDDTFLDIYKNKEFFPTTSSHSTPTHVQFESFRKDYTKRVKMGFNSTIGKSVLVNLTKKLNDLQQYPAIFFCFSRKKCQQYSQWIPQVLVDHETRGHITRTFEFYLVKLLPESQRSIPQVLLIKKLVEKGIAFHHSGLLPALKEIVEILFSKGWIKILFATETFAVGVNMPARTVVFTGIEKHDDRGWRTIRTDEYIQMSGRAGRRGLDKLGRVVIAPIEHFPTRHDLHSLMTGNSPYIISQLIINPVLLLQAMDAPSFNIKDILQQSLWYFQRQDEIKQLETEIDKLTKNALPLEISAEHQKYLQQYLQKSNSEQQLENNMKSLGFMVKKKKNKKKNKNKDQENIINKWPTKEKFQQDLEQYQSYQNSLDYLQLQKNKLKTLTSEIETTTSDLMTPLEKMGFITINEDQPNLTTIGKIASRCHECPSLLTALAFHQGLFDNLSSSEVVAILAILASENEKTDQQILTPVSIESLKVSVNLEKSLNKLVTISHTLQEKMNITNSLSYNLMHACQSWADGCSLTYLRENGCDLYEGNLVKLFLKISHMVQEIIEIYQSLDLLDQVVLWENIEKIMVRDFVKVESIYLI